MAIDTIVVQNFPVPSTFTSNTLIFSLNSTRIALVNPDPDLTLLEFIRAQGLTGTKLACGEGGCGACTVVFGFIVQGKARYRAVNACLAPLISVHGGHIITVEGIGSSEKPHPVQERVGKMFGSQCGYCTPGIVASLYTTIRNGGGNLFAKEIEESLDGNLCRCTGYRPILDAAKTFAIDAPPLSNVKILPLGVESPPALPNPDSLAKPSDDDLLPIHTKEATAVEGHKGATTGIQDDDPAPILCGKGEGCCKNGGGGCGGDSNGKPMERKMIPGVPQFEFKAYDPGAEPLFPPWLKKQSQLIRGEDLVLVQKRNVKREELGRDGEELMDEEVGNVWLRPGSVQSLVECMKRYPGAKIRSGNSETGIEVKFKASRFAVSVFVSEHLSELATFESSDEGMKIGGALPLTDLIGECKKALETYKERNGTVMLLQAVLDNVKYFAGTQIRNVATISGNITTASPISDLNPVWTASNAVLHYIDVAAEGGPVEGSVEMRKFFLGYRKTALPPSAIVTGLFVPFPKETDTFKVFTRAYKQSKRKDDDIAIVTSCLRVELDGNVIKEVSLVYGGMSPITKQSTATEAFLKGKVWGDATVFDGALDCLGSKDYALPYGVPGGMAAYRKALTLGFFTKFWVEVLDMTKIALAQEQDLYSQLTNNSIHRGLSKGSQDLEDVDIKKVVGQSLAHLASMKQVTGEAVYTDDMPKRAGEMYAGLVLSQKPHAKILGIDATKALRMEGVVDMVTSKDIKGSNIFGPPAMDEPILAEDEVFSTGQVIAVIVADTKSHAQAAARAVVVTYEELPYILTIDQAIAADSYFKPRPKLERGDLSKMDECDFVLEGRWKFGGQEHFYFETQGCLVIPGMEDDEMEIFSSTQNPTEVQIFVASILGIPQNRCVVRAKRLGGGFGGKETRSIPLAAQAALAAKKVKRPVRIQLDRDEDMVMSGQRHPFSADWKVGFTKEGKIIALDSKIYNNGGWTQDLSQAVLERAMTHSDNCYYIPNLRIEGKICKTNTMSNTAFRGFGGPQGAIFMEYVLTMVATKLQIDPDVIREKNMYVEGQSTHFGQELLDWNVPALWDQLKQSAEVDERKRKIEEFNSVNKWKKRGISMMPNKFGISFTALMLNQAHALVHIYNHDGSVLLSHGGTEMGQ